MSIARVDRLKRRLTGPDTCLEMDALFTRAGRVPWRRCSLSLAPNSALPVPTQGSNDERRQQECQKGRTRADLQRGDRKSCQRGTKACEHATEVSHSPQLTLI